MSRGIFREIRQGYGWRGRRRVSFLNDDQIQVQREMLKGSAAFMSLRCPD